MEKKNQNIFNLNQLTATLFKVVVLSLVSLALPAGFAPALAANPVIGQEATIIARTNAIRLEAGLPALVTDSRLMRSAAAKANDMVSKSYFEHTNPDGARMGYWMNAQGYTFALAGENLGKGFTAVDRLMNAWVASPSHYKNLVEPKFTDIGVGIAEGLYDGQMTLFVVQHFGVEATPAEKEVAPLVSLVAPLVETVAGATTSRTIVNEPITISTPVVKPVPVATIEPPAPTSQLKFVEVALANPNQNPTTPATPSASQFWPIFVLFTLALIGYLEEYLPLWAILHPMARK